MSPCACGSRKSKKIKREERKAQQERDAKRDQKKKKSYELRSPRGKMSFATKLEAEAAQRRLGSGTIHTL